MPDVLPFPSYNALPASGTAPAEVIPLPVRPNSLTKSDVAALRALIPELTAGSRYAGGCDDAGDVWAIISGGNGETFQAYLLTRGGTKLELEDLRAPLASDLVEVYDSFAELAAALGNEIGWRHADAG
jgi:hypothetical protein